MGRAAAIALAGSQLVVQTVKRSTSRLRPYMVREDVAGSLAEGDVFGEISLFTGEPAPYLVRDTSECRLLVLDARHFAFMLVCWPILYHKFLEKLSNR